MVNLTDLCIINTHLYFIIQGLASHYAKVEHERIHTGDKPVHCDQCSEVFCLNDAISFVFNSLLLLKNTQIEVSNQSTFDYAYFKSSSDRC